MTRKLTGFEYATSRRRDVRPGTVVMEFALSLPVLLFVAALLVYFGRAIMHLDQSWTVDRYEAWRYVAEGDGPRPDQVNGHPQINQAFFNNKAGSLEYELSGDRALAAHDELITEGSQHTPSTVEVMRQAFGVFPAYINSSFTADHPSGSSFWSGFDGAIVHSHTRIGNDWKFANGWASYSSKERTNHAFSGGMLNGDPWMLWPVRDTLLQPLDVPLQSIELQPNPLAGFVRSIYSGRPPYVGPVVYVSSGP